MRRLIRSRLIWISTVCKCISEFTWYPKFHDFTLGHIYDNNRKKITMVPILKKIRLILKTRFKITKQVACSAILHAFKLLSSADFFFQNQLHKLSECQTVYMDPDWVQPVCKGYQQTFDYSCILQVTF